MGRKYGLVILVVAFSIICLTIGGCATKTGTGTKDTSVRNMNVTAEIVKVYNGYAVRGTAQSVIFTVLNPAPEILDELAKSGKTVVVDVYIVSGDTVNIEKINGDPYP